MLKDLLDFLNTRAGKLHRATVLYEGTDITSLYIRDDLDEEQLQSKFSTIVNRILPESTEEEDIAFSHLGELEASVRVFNEAVVLHFPRSDGRGVIVSLEATAARELNTFIVECQRRLRD